MNIRKSFLSVLISVFAFGVLGSSCSDMLSPNMDRYTENYAQDSVYSEFGILMSVQKVVERCVLLDESRGDLVSTGKYTTDSIMELVNYLNPEDGTSALLNAADFYHIINSCNFYLDRVDTISTKNGYVELKREAAETQVIRGWAYLQLVKIYGEVPFITEPISSTSDADRLMKSAQKINKDNIADLLIEAGLYNAFTVQLALGLPSYQSVNNGSTTYSTSMLMMPAQLILGDAYLMQNNYEDAATMYYSYFFNSSKFTNPANSTQNSSYNSTSSPIRNSDDVITGYTVSAWNWLNLFKNRQANEKFVISVGATSESYGRVMNELKHVYGFATTINSGSVTVVANQKYQQLAPSTQYVSLNENQIFNKYQLDGDVEERTPLYYENNETGDARLYYATPQIEFQNGDRVRFVNKFCPVSNTNSVSSLSTRSASPSAFAPTYDIALYRNPQVWLRYAEAINRMGFPQMAFGVLKDALNRQNLPTYTEIDKNPYYIITQIDEIDGEIISIDTLGVYDIKEVVDPMTGETRLDSTLLLFKDGYAPFDSLLAVPGLVPPTALNGGCYYVGVEEAKNALDYPKCMDFKTPSKFSAATLNTNGTYYGIHGRGCGDVGGTRDTCFTYAKMVAKKIAENEARMKGLSYDAQLAYEATLYSGDTLLVTDKDLIINAVEDLIIDEGALECAFEGSRFGDLMRVASHKNKSAVVDGTDWLAWKVARRNKKVTDNASEVDADLYAKLKNTANWYFQLPKY